MRPEDHHVDCDYRNSYNATHAAEALGVPEDAPGIYDCTCGRGMTPHTPGPWEAERYTDAAGAMPAMYRVNFLDVDGCHGTLTDRLEDADARLIAAAPDLLAALLKVREFVALYPLAHREREIVEAAIARATDA